MHGKNGHYHGPQSAGGSGEPIINAVDPKERIKEYHDIVNQKRKKIY